MEDNSTRPHWPPPERIGAWLPYAAIISLAALLVSPAALGPTRLNDSYWIDWVWLDQFARELGRGLLYPRWLPLSHNGLGSPVFYYYPPLAFYLGSIFVGLGFSTYASVMATFFAGYVIGGVAMLWWLRGQARAPVLGALVYMALPYHAFDFTVRGALAETVATAIVPLVMLGLRHIAERRRSGFALTSASYGALILTHLPFALLASLFLIAPYAVWLWRRRWRNYTPVAAALAAGIGLAAISLVPALALEPFRDSAKLWDNPMHRPQNWNLLNASSLDPQSFAGLLLAIAATIGIPLLVLAVRHRSFWSVWGFACVLLAIGAVPLLWSLPLLRSVQFPFRLLPVAEFALATSIATATARPLTLGVLTLPFAFLTFTIATAPPGAQSFNLAELQALHPDVPENLPPGERPFTWPSRWALQVAARNRQPQFVEGATTEPTFYFPSWQVRCAGARSDTFPAARTKLLSYRGRGCEKMLVLTAAEKIGALASLLALAGLIAVSRSARLCQHLGLSDSLMR